MRFVFGKAIRGVLLVLSGAGSSCLGACQAGRVVPPVSMAQSVAVAPAQPPVIKVRGHVYGSRDSATVVSGAELIFSVPGADLLAQRWRAVTSADGAYQVAVPAGATYVIALNKDGLNIETQEFAMPAGRADTSRVVKNFYIGPNENYVSEDRWPTIYFSPGRAVLRPESLATLDTIATIIRTDPRFRMSIEGHTDAVEVPRGQANREQCLLELGRQRAKAARAYLQKQGVPESCLLIVSYGSQRPAAPNDTPEHQQYNRKVECKAIYVEGLNYRYGELRRKSFGVHGSEPTTGRSELAIREPGPIIFFDTNQAVLRPETMTVLDNLFRLLQNNPGIGIGVSLEGHAEPREVPRGQPGREQYLVALAQRRAQAAYDYLRKKGVPKSQLITHSYGGQRLAAPNDTPENRQLNRRVECKSVRIELIESQLKAGKSHLQMGTSVSGKKNATGAPHPKKAPAHAERQLYFISCDYRDGARP